MIKCYLKKKQKTKPKQTQKTPQTNNKQTKKTPYNNHHHKPQNLTSATVKQSAVTEEAFCRQSLNLNIFWSPEGKLNSLSH